MWRWFVALMFSGLPLPGVAADNGSLAALLQQCAPQVHPMTMGSLVAVESGGNPYVLLDEGLARLPNAQRTKRSYRAQSKAEAVAVSQSLIRDGHIVSMGLSQVNHQNLPKLGMTVEDIFDPCKNVAAGQRILVNFYMQAAALYGAGPEALRHALSGYNSGSMTAGIANGYVDKVLARAREPLPALKVFPVYAGGWLAFPSGVGGHGVMSSKVTARRNQEKTGSFDVDFF